MQDTVKYDIGIIGGGPGGYTAALEAAKNGLRVVMFEADRMGGTCLNRGCIPTKYLSHIAKIRSDVIAAKESGILFRDSSIDFGKIQAQKHKTMDALRKNLEDSLMASKIDIIHKKASLTELGQIVCGNDTYYATSIIIATGATVKEPLFEGFLNTDGLLEINHLQQTIKIVGGGMTAVEFAEIFCQLGVDVKLQVRSRRLLNKWNAEVSASISRLLKGKGVKIETNCTPEVLQKADAEICVSAAGVQPCLSGLNEKLFEIGDSGGIITDEFGRTKSSCIYAVGDVTDGSTQLAHHAMEEGKRAVWHILGRTMPMKPKVVRCIYTCPELAEAGYTEEQAKAENLPYETVKFPLYSNSMNMIYGGERGYIRLIADREKGTLIGAQMMCERASDMISELALAINAEVPISECAKSVRPHPSFSEGISDAFVMLQEKMK